MSGLAKLVSSILVLVSIASMSHCETVAQSKILSTTNDLPHGKLSEEQLSKIMSLIATNFIPLLEKEIEVGCLPIARRLDDYATDLERQKCLNFSGMMRANIRGRLRNTLLPFFWGMEYAPEVLEAKQAHLDFIKKNVVRNWFGSGSVGDPNISYETALETAKPSLQITHAILSSHFKAKMYEEVSNILLEQLKDSKRPKVDQSEKPAVYS